MNMNLLCFLGLHRYAKSWRCYLFPMGKAANAPEEPVVLQQRWCCDRWPCKAKRTTYEDIP